MFTHLHVHTEFSLLDGMGTAKQYAERARSLGQKFLACTDHGSIDGVISFQKECLKVGVQPIIGCEAYIVPNFEVKPKGEKRGHVILLVKNKTGWINLCEMLTIANLQGFYYKPRIDFNLLAEKCSGLVVLTGCPLSFLNFPEGEKLLKVLNNKTDVFLEVMPTNAKFQIDFNIKIKLLSQKYGISMVGTNDCHYVNEDDVESQEVLLAIQSKAKWDDPKRFKFDVDGLYLKSSDEMRNDFMKQKVFNSMQVDSLIKITSEIAKLCSGFKIEKHKVMLPRLKRRSKTLTEYELIERICLRGLREKIPRKKWKQYKKRLYEELSLFKEKKFIRYFLIVWDLCNKCRKMNVPFGPGRGSVGGCLTAYLMGITMVDSVEHDLLFSRFASKDRVDLPDIDIDFDYTKRHLVRDYLESVYGKGSITNVSTFGRLKGKAVIRDVSRVFQVPSYDVESMVSAVDKVVVDSKEMVSVKTAVDELKEAKNFQAKYPHVIKHAIKLEGQVRTASQHASALIVSNGDIISEGRGVLVRRGDNIVINWDKDDCESMGLMKFDALGLKNISIIEETRNLVYKNRGEKIDFHKVDLNDEAVLNQISKGNNAGIFQISGYATSRVLEEMKIENFNDIVALIALSRPGVKDSGMTDLYCERQRTKRWERKHEVYEKITSKTYGVIVYQEQVMAVINKVAGLSYETADKIRKVIGKKRSAKEFAPYKKEFIEGCLNTGYFSKKEAVDFWEGLQKHAKYSFNKSHSVEYAMIAYWMAWLKYYYLTEFICASLTFCEDNKKDGLLLNACDSGVEIVPPKVSFSDGKKWKVVGEKLYVPFSEINGFGDSTTDRIRIAKTNKTKKGLFGEAKVDLSFLNTYQLKTLERLKSFDDNVYPVFSEVNDLFKFNVEVVGRFDVCESKPYSISWIDDILECDECGLRKQATAPVLPSYGRSNAAIIGEAPGFEEDKHKIGFYGRSGQLLWKTIAERSILLDFMFTRRDFYVTNVCKCFPKITKTPTFDELQICGDLWLSKELFAINCKVALVFGNVGVKYFLNKSGGIKTMSGKTVWSQKYKMKLCFCVHPSAVLRNRNEYYEFFVKGIDNFLRIVAEGKSNEKER